MFFLKKLYVTFFTVFKTGLRGFPTCRERVSFIGKYWQITVHATFAILPTGLQFLKSFFCSESELNRVRRGTDGIGIPRSILKAFMMVLGLLDEFNAFGGTLNGVVVMLWQVASLHHKFFQKQLQWFCYFFCDDENIVSTWRSFSIFYYYITINKSIINICHSGFINIWGFWSRDQI